MKLNTLYKSPLSISNTTFNFPCNVYYVRKSSFGIIFFEGNLIISAFDIAEILELRQIESEETYVLGEHTQYFIILVVYILQSIHQ